MTDAAGNPVAGASVSAADGQVRDYTSLDGSFALDHVPSSITKIHIKGGDDSQVVDLDGRDSANLQIMLE